MGHFSKLYTLLFEGAVSWNVLGQTQVILKLLSNLLTNYAFVNIKHR